MNFHSESVVAAQKAQEIEEAAVEVEAVRAAASSPAREFWWQAIHYVNDREEEVPCLQWFLD